MIARSAGGGKSAALRGTRGEAGLLCCDGVVENHARVFYNVVSVVVENHEFEGWVVSLQPRSQEVAHEVSLLLGRVQTCFPRGVVLRFILYLCAYRVSRTKTSLAIKQTRRQAYDTHNTTEPSKNTPHQAM